MKKIALLIILFVIVGHTFAQVGGKYGCKASAVENGILSIDAINTEGAVILFEENMDDVSLLEPAGWIFNDVDGVGITTYFQGNTAVFDAYNGETDSYFAQNFNGAFDDGLYINQWLITPEIECSGATRFTFWAKGAGEGYDDHIYIYYSPTGSSDINDFELLRDKTTLPVLWTQYSELVNVNGPVRFAVQYYETKGGPLGAESNYWGIDAIKVLGSSNPVPISIWWTLVVFSLLIIGVVSRKLFIR